jgi:tetratricopeptide (TPR) repeat protein
MDLEPQRRLDDRQIDALRSELKRAEEALTISRDLTELSEGRAAIVVTPDFLSTNLNRVQDVREIAYLLASDSLAKAEAEDADGALHACRAVLNSGRSIGEEPFPIAQLVRIAARAIAQQKEERVLAQGEPSQDALRQFQKALELEDQDNVLLVLMRGERAGLDQLMQGLQNGTWEFDVDGTTIPRGSKPFTPSARISYTIQRAALLRYMNRAVEIAQSPAEQRATQYSGLQASVTKKLDNLFVGLFTPPKSVIEACQRSHAQLRCAIAATAAERYQQALGRWPDDLNALKDGGYLREVPNDPYDGQPLRLKRLDDGLVIYTLGPDCVDNGGRIDRKDPRTPGTDIGFRLWDPAAQRQPPAPPKPPG